MAGRKKRRRKAPERDSKRSNRRFPRSRRLSTRESFTTHSVRVSPLSPPQFLSDTHKDFLHLRFAILLALYSWCIVALWPILLCECCFYTRTRQIYGMACEATETRSGYKKHYTMLTNGAFISLYNLMRYAGMEMAQRSTWVERN